MAGIDRTGRASSRASRSTPTCRRSRASGSSSPTSTTPSRSTARARSTTSTASSCTTCASPCAGHARSCATAARCSAPDVLAWAEPGLKLVGDVTSPPRDLDVQVLEWDGAVAVLDDADRRALEPLHRQLLRDRAAAHDDARRPPARRRRHRTAAPLARRRRTSPMDPTRRRADGAASDSPTSCATASPRPSGGSSSTVGRSRPTRRPSDVHDVRKDAKKLRYLLECFADLFPSEGRKAFVKRLKKLQDLLGEHQDAEVHADELRRAAEQLPPTTGAATYVAVGRLVEHLERTRQAARDGFAERFAEYDSRPRARCCATCWTVRPVKVLATYSIKGGVGKTTAAVNLAAEAARAGARVLLWDLDPQGAATFFVRVKPRLKGGAERLVSEARRRSSAHVRATDIAGVDVLPADFSLRHLDLHLDDADARPPRRPARRRRAAPTTSPCSTARRASR